MSPATVASSGGVLRVFFGLWPEPAAATALARVARDLREEAGGRTTRTDTLHLTVAFLGDVATAAVDRLVAAPVRSDPFEIVLDRLGVWKHNGIGWVAPGAVTPALEALHGELRHGLQSAGFAPDDRPFRPHVTLVRRCERGVAQRAIAPIAWVASELVLVQSVLAPAGARYETLARFPFGR